MSQKSSANAGNIAKFKVGNLPDDLASVVLDIQYKENILQSSVKVEVDIEETGLTSEGSFSMLDHPSNPIRGGEEVILEIEDAQRVPNKLSFKKEKLLYVNGVGRVLPTTQNVSYRMDLCPREFLANNQTRIVRRYDGQISNNIRKILTETGGIETEKDIETDITAIPYNFIGNDKKPFSVCKWLCPKAIPAMVVGGKSTIGGASGYFFFENYDGFKFKAVDKILEGNPVKRYIMTGKPAEEPPGYDGKITDVSIGRFINLEQNLNLGLYANQSIFFDYYMMEYKIRNYNIDSNMKDKVRNTGKKDLGWVHEAFRKGPSRLMTHILDVGTLPAGRSTEEQLKTWKEHPERPTYDAANSMVQSIMRYGQLFNIQTNVTISGDFSLRAGDLIYCDFPTTSVDSRSKNDPNKETGGIYMIAGLCHRMTKGKTSTNLTLVRDTFGRIPFKD